MADPTQGDPSQFQTPFDLQVANTPNFINAAYSTPQQRAQLYAYANALTQPGQVKNGWQGIGEIARALTGGYVGHLADQYEGQNYAHNLDQTTPQGGAAPAPPVAAPGGSAPPASAPAASASPLPNNGPYGGLGASVAAFGGSGSSASDVTDPKAHEAFIRSYAASKGVDPDFAAAVARGEGLGAVSPKNPSAASSVDIDPKTGKPFSFGDFQLNVRDGLGTVARANGVDPADPSQWQSADKFAIDYMASHDASPWKGDGGVNAYGLGKNGMSYATPRISPAGVSPAMAAIGSALINGGGQTRPAGVQVAGDTPFTPQQLGAMISNPNLPDHVRAMAMHLTQPTQITDAVGNVSPLYQGSTVGPTMFRGGVLGPAAPLPGGIPSQPVYGGTVANPTVNTLTPVGPMGSSGGATGAGAGAWTPDAMERLKGLAAAGQGITAQGDVIKDKAKSANDRFTATQDKQWQIQQAAQPLLQVKNVMDQHGGMLPTGEGADKLLSVTSAANMLSTLLGHPIQTDGSTQSGLELLRKYGTQVAASLAGNSTDAGRAAAQHMSPSLDLSNATNEHLVDNYLRLNNLAKTRNDFERNYYLSHGGQSNPNVYDNFNTDWQNAISGKNAVPLSGEKYGRQVQVKLKDGTTATRIVVPSTDPSGYSVYKPGEIPDVSTP